MQQYDGIFVLNKPKGPTSARCVEKIKRMFKQKKVGHAGTLDPLASGVLIILLGQGTKLASYFMESYKVYRGVIRLGIETDTYDITGKIVRKVSNIDIGEEEIIEAILDWKNLKDQEVPSFSAAKHKGIPFYSITRQGEKPPKKVKKISIDEVELLNIDLPLVEFRIRCGGGTYVRSLAHSLGKRLGTGAVLKELIREEVYPYRIEQATSLEELRVLPSIFWERVIPLSESLPHWPRVIVDRAVAEKIKNGRLLKVGEIGGAYPKKEGEKYLFLESGAYPLAIMETRRMEEGLYWKILRGLWGKRQ